MYILMGNIMNSTGITERIFRFAAVCVGWWRGGLCHANILGSVIFSGMSGSAVADAGGIGIIEIKAMKDAGYDVDTAAAITAASATIGPIIPPSLPMIIYGVSAEASIGGLFAGGVIPGLLMALALMVMVWAIAKKKNMPSEPFPSLREVWDAFRGAFWALMTPVILFAGMLSGYFTATESAAVAAFYALSSACSTRIPLSGHSAPRAGTVETTGIVMALIMASDMLAYCLAVSRIPQELSAVLPHFLDSQTSLPARRQCHPALVGTFLEPIPAMLILIPILVPPALALGIDPIQFGVIFTLNLMIGTLTPPVGSVLSSPRGSPESPFDRVTRATMPFLWPLLAVLMAITLWPPLTTWLPTLLIGR